MANEFKSLLVKLGLSTKEWSVLVQQIKKEAQDVQAQTKANAQAATAAAKENVIATQSAVLEEKRLQAETKTLQAINQANLVLAKQKTAEQQIHIIKVKEETLEIQKQIALLRLEQARKKAENGGKGEGGFLSTLLGGAGKELSGLAGGGLLGSIFGGAVLGGGVLAIAEGLAAALGKIAEKMKEFITSSGPLQQVEEQFEKLTRRIGIDGPEMMEKLQVATHNLVGDLTLLRTANGFLQKDTKLTEDQIVELTKVTVGLARAQGKDASQAMNALARASLTGRTAILSMVTGVDRHMLQLKGLPKSVDAATRSHLEFVHTLEVLKARYDAIGEPQLTFTDRMKQLQVVTERFWESFAKSAVQSSGITKFFSDIVDGMGKLEGLGQTLGTAFGGVLSVIEEAFRAIADVVKIAYDGVVALLSPLGDLWRAFSKAVGVGTSKEINDTTERLTTLKGVFKTLAEVVAFLGLVFKDTFAIAKGAAIEVANTVKNMGHMLKGDFNKMVPVFATDSEGAKSVDNDWKKNGEEMWQRFYEIENRNATKPGGIAKTENKIADHAGAAAEAVKLAKMRVELTKVESKEKIEIVTATIAAENKILDEQLKTGKIRLTDFIVAKKALDKSAHDQRIADIQVELQAEQSMLDIEKRAGKLTPAEYDLKSQILATTTQGKIRKENDTFGAQNAALDAQDRGDTTAAAKVAVKGEIELTKQLYKEVQKLTEAAFKNREITAEQYIQLRKQQIQVEFEDTIQSIKDRHQFEEASLKRDAAIAADVAKAKQQYESQVTLFTEQQVKLRDQFAKQGFDNAKQELQGVLTIVQGDSAQGANSTLAVNLMTQLRDLSLEYLKNREAALQTEQIGTEEWHKTRLEILAGLKDVQTYNTEIIRAKDILTPLSNAFSSLSSSLGSVSKMLGGAFKAGADTAHAFSQLRQVFQQGSSDPVVQLKHNLEDVFAKVKTSSVDTGTKFSALSMQTADVKTKLQVFGDALFDAKDKVRQAVDNLVASFQTAGAGVATRSGVLGALPGTQTPSLPDLTQILGTGSSVSLGSSASSSGTVESQSSGLGGFFHKIFDRFSLSSDKAANGLTKFTEKISAGVGAVTNLVSAFTNATSAAGGALSGGSSALSAVGAFSNNPYALAGGAAAGAILGSIIGNKQSQAQKAADQIKQTMSQIVQNINDGTTSLKDGIVQLNALKQTAITTLGNDKKGKKQLPGILQSLDQQISALQAKQKAILADLMTQLNMLQAPEAYQGWLNNIQSILDKYKQFSEAAANTADLANAQQFLTESLKRYSETLQNDLAGANQTAINDAIQLIDLQQKRLDLTTQEAQQEYDILTKGNLTRQRTNAQTKGEEITKLRAQTQLQLDQIDQQLALTQFKVDGEKTVFHLATTRISLEAQLLVLQKNQSLLDLQRIQGLQAIIAALSSGNVTTLNQLLVALGFLPPGAASASQTVHPLETQLFNLAQERGQTGLHTGFSFSSL